MEMYFLEADHSTRPVRDEAEMMEQYRRWEAAGYSKPGHPKVVDVTQIGEVTVSTVFLCIDHNFGGGEPLLFETMVFGVRDKYRYTERYHTWAEAEEGHARIVAMIKRGEEP